MRPLEKYMYPFYLRISKLQSGFYFKLNSSVEVLATNLDAKQYLITTLALMVSKYCCCQDKNQRSPLLHSEPILFSIRKLLGKNEDLFQSLFLDI